LRQNRGGRIRWAIAVICLGVMMLLAACKKAPEDIAREQLELGEKYLSEGNYDEAIVAFSKAIEIEPKNAKAYEGLSKAYEENGDYELAAQTLREGKQALGTDELDSRISEIEKIILQQENQRTGEEYAGRIEELLSAFQAEEVQEEGLWKLDDDFNEWAATLKEPLVLSEKDGQYLVIYPGGYIYYGQMQQGKRWGEGIWCFEGNGKARCFDGQWRDDKPNGAGVVRTYQDLEKLEQAEGKTYSHSSVYTGNFTDGVYDGAFNIVWYMNTGKVHEWDATYLGGALQAIDGENAAYCKQCDANLRASETISHVFGID